MNLENYIRNVPNFPKAGIQFKDISPLLQNPKAFAYSIEKMAEEWGDKNIDSIGGFDARGFIFGTALAYHLEKPFFPLRKPGKLPYYRLNEEYSLEYGTNSLEVHVDAFNKGDNILLVDDLLATGGTMAAGCSLVERLRGNVIGCQVLIELEGLKGRELLPGYEVKTLLQYD